MATGVQFSSELQKLKRFIEATYGPFGRLVSFPLDLKDGDDLKGCCKSISARSGLIYSQWPSKGPRSKVLLNTLTGLSQKNKDGGKFAALLLTRILLSSIEDDSLPKSKHVLSSMVHLVLKQAAQFLGSPCCSCRVRMDHANLESMSVFVKSFLRSRSHSILNETDLEHLAHCILKGFVSSVPWEAPNDRGSPLLHEPLRIVTYPGEPLRNSRVIEGVLIEASMNRSVKKAIRKGPRNAIITAVFDISLAGDSEEGILQEESFLIKDNFKNVTFESVIVSKIKECIDKLIERGLRFVACQKIIHPAVKQHLARKGVIVIDRLSIQHIGSVSEVAGGHILKGYHSNIPSQWLGSLKDIKELTFGSRKYVQLIGFDSMCHTLVLSCYVEQLLEDLKNTCSDTVDMLRHTLNLPFALLGGGCTETLLAHYIRQQIGECDIRGTGGSTRDFERVVEMVSGHVECIAASLEHYSGISVTDSIHHHCWSLPPLDDMDYPLNEETQYMNTMYCNCGMYLLRDLPPASLLRDIRTGLLYSKADLLPDRSTLDAKCLETHPQETLFQGTHPQETLFQGTHPQETLFRGAHPQEAVFRETHPQETLLKGTHPQKTSFKEPHQRIKEVGTIVVYDDLTSKRDTISDVSDVILKLLLIDT